ncbi:MAG: TonB-dependent receptor [Bryobacterales bacterium]|nr:TonB-dependent receptor [Bryobacterales bacterium]
MDPARAAIGKAWILLHSANNSVTRKTLTDAQGAFVFANLSPGGYLIEARAFGLGGGPPKMIALQAGRDAVADIVLELDSLPQRVVVTASGTPLSIDATAKALDTTELADIERRAEFSMTEVLRQTPGMRVQQLGGPGALTQIHTRGLRSFDTAVVVDGFRLRDAGSPQGDATAFLGDLLVVDPARVEVLRGSGASLYGSHAIGGVIQIVTDPGGGPLHGEIATEGGGLGFFRGLARVSGGAAKDRLQYSAGVAHMNVARGVDGDDRARNGSVQSSAQFLFTPQSRLSARVWAAGTFTQLNSSPFAGATANLPSHGLIGAIPQVTFIPALNDPDARRSGRQVSALLSFVQELRPGSTLRFGYQGLTTSRDNRDGPAGLRFPPAFNNSSKFDGLIHSLQARIDSTLGRHQLLSAGYEFEVEQFENLATDENPNAARRLSARTRVRQRSGSVFAQDQIRLFDSRLLISLSGRLQRFALRQPEFEGGVPAYSTPRFDAPPDAYTGDVAVAYLLRPGAKLRAHAGNAYRAAALYERFGTFFFSGAFSALGDPRLSPERALSMDAGFDQYFLGSRLRTGATYFYTQLQNVIGFGALLGADPFGRFSGYRNVRGALARGVEWSAEAALTSSTRMLASYTHTRSQQRNSVFVEGFLYSPRVPRHMGTWLVSQRLGNRIEMTADLSWSGESITPMFAGTGTRGFVFGGARKLDIAASYTVPVSDRWRVQLFTRIDNALNQTWFEDGFRVPKAWAVGGLKLLF